MDVRKEIMVLCEILNLTEQELASNLQVTYESVNNWKNNRKRIDDSSLEKLYSYAYLNDISFNQIFEQLLIGEHSSDDNIVLFHGAKKIFTLPININDNSKIKNDFGIGFYLGTSFTQAANYISFLDTNKVYVFKLDTKDLKITKFDVDNEWMLAIAYYRGWLADYKDKPIIEKILKKVENCDVIIAPIADNRMFDIIGEFVENIITDEQCRHVLAATNLGYQYVLKSSKSINQTTFLKEMYVCKKEKEHCTGERFSLTNNGLQKVKMARIEYKNKGNYIEELLK